MTDKQKLIVIADFFANEVLGGAELWLKVLLEHFEKFKTFDVLTIKSQDVSLSFLEEHKDKTFFISNFKMLNETSKKKFYQDKLSYFIVEHDWKFIKQDNPALYKDFVVPEEEIINKDFYKNAQVVFCQSQLHADIFQKNLRLKNVFNLGLNLWSKEELQMLRERLNSKKTRKFGIMNSNNKNKGTEQTIQVCKENGISYDLIPFLPQNKFYDELSKTETLVFFPTWVESYCRVAVEARILGCKLMTNKLLGCASQNDFKDYKGDKLLECIETEKWIIIDDLTRLLQGHDELKVYFEDVPQLPKVSLITTTYNAEKFIDGYLKMWDQQTINDESELIIIDANSTDKTLEIIKEYKKDKKNVLLIENNEKITTSKAFNVATEMARGEFIGICLVDDRLSPDYLEIMAKHLYLDPEVDLIYSDVFQTTKPNETFENNSSRGRLYEHSKADFTKTGSESLIKSVAGPTQMYRKSTAKKLSGWNEKMLYACDWDLWCRMVRSGSKFKKINKPLSLYYFNPNGLSTGLQDQEKTKNRHKEEKWVFNEYKDLFPKGYETYKMYFDSL